MADTRINALSTATSSASDDFVPIDGTTNGTRKLSAYSPSFGGNATVGGTLTVSGSTVTGGSSGLTLSAGGTDQSVTLTPSGTGEVRIGSMRLYPTVNGFGGLSQDTAFGTYANYATLLVQNGAEKARVSTGGNFLIGGTSDIPGSGGLKVYGTTASTSTSSGALVVSGGVGVAGNTNIGGVASVGGSSSAAVGVYVINTALTGTDQYGVASEPIWTSAANLGHTLWARTKTAASAFTLTAGHGVFVEIPTLGAGSAITNNYGVRINNQGTTGVTNAYGLYVASQSGASTLNYAIYTAGGRINFQGLPTSSAGLPAGTLWNDSGTLKVA